MFDREGWTRYLDYAQQHVPWELAGSAVTAAVALLVLALLAKRLPPNWCCVAVLAAAMLDLGDQTIGNFSLERRGQGTGNRAKGTDGAAGNANWVRVADHANFQFWPGSLHYSRLVPLVVASKLPSVATNDGGVLPGGLSRLYRAIEKTPSVGLALAGCNYTCDRTGDVWEPLGGALPRFRLLRAADRELVFTPLEELTRAQLDSLREGLLGSVQIDHEDPQNLALHLSAPEDGLLVVADLFYPGWHCEVDGRPVAVEAAHGVFRAVALSKGDHRVEFAFHSASFRWGAWCSLAALAVVGVLVLVQRPTSKV